MELLLACRTAAAMVLSLRAFKPCCSYQFSCVIHFNSFILKKKDATSRRKPGRAMPTVAGKVTLQCDVGCMHQWPPYFPYLFVIKLLVGMKDRA